MMRQINQSINQMDGHKLHTGDLISNDVSDDFFIIMDLILEIVSDRLRIFLQFPREYPTIIEVHLGIIKQVCHKSNAQVYSIWF